MAISQFWPIRFIIIFVTFLIFTTSIIAQENPPITLYYGNGCPHCEIVIDHFNEQGYFDTYNIDQQEIYFDRDNAQDFTQTMDRLNIPLETRGVPTLVVGSQVLIGDGPIINQFSTLINTPSPTPSTITQAAAPTNQPLTLGLVIAAAAVDAINPCAFAVLIILMSTILIGGQAKKALFSGIAFSLSIFLSYFLMGLGLYHAIGATGVSQTIITIIGTLAIILGLLNLKDYFWYGKGFLMEVPMSWRPKLKSFISSVTGPFGAFLVGFIVSLFLLPCTSGPYIVILGMLANKTTQAQALLYLIIYNLIFVVPMIIITLLVYKGLSPKKLESMRQNRLRLLHLIAGLILIGMGVVLLAGWI